MRSCKVKCFFFKKNSYFNCFFTFFFFIFLDYEYPSEEETQEFIPFSRCRILNITERELKRRKRIAQNHGEREPLNSFFRQAELELQKMKKIRKHQKNISAFNQRIEALNREIQLKNETIHTLQASLKQKTQLLDAVQTYQHLIPKDWNTWNPAHFNNE